MEVGQTSISFKHATAIGELADANGAEALKVALEAKAAGDAARVAGEAATEAGNTAVANAAKAAEDAQTATQKIAGVVGSMQSIGTGLEQLKNDLNLYVKDGDVINQINIDTTGVVIDGKKVTITGETSIASGVIGTAQIADGSIGTAKIANAAIGTAKIANAAIGTAQIADGSIGTAKIANAAIGTAQVSTIAANKISAASLSAISANLGAITAGSPVNGIYPFEVAANGSVATHSLTLDNAYNLVYNSEFYANGIEWDARSGFETSPTGVVLEGQGHNGSNAIGFTASNADFHSQHRMPELQGKTISVSIWVKANATADTIDLVLSDENMGGQVLTSHEVHHTSSGNWELLKLENLAIEGNNSVLYVRVRNATQAGAYYGMISQPLIVQQSTAGTYVPSSSIRGGWIVDSHIVNSDINIYDNGNMASLTSGGLTFTGGTNNVSILPLALQIANTRNGNDVTVSPGSVEITNTKGNVTVSDGNIYVNPQGKHVGTTNSLITGNLIVGGTGHRIFTTDVGGIYFGKDNSSPEILHAAKLATYSLASIKTDITRYDDDDALQSILDTDIYSWRHAAHPEKFVQISPVIDDTGNGYKMGKDVLDDDGETINNNNMIGLLFGAVKALNAKIDAKYRERTSHR